MNQLKKYKASNITLFSRRCSTLIIFCLISLVIIPCNRSLFPQEDCGECPHPLVGVAGMKITGDLEAARDMIEGFMDYEFPGRLPERIYGWDALLGNRDGSTAGGRLIEQDLMARITELHTFRGRNSCAKLILNYSKVGAAKKYRIESTAEIKIGNGQVEIEHVSDTGIERRSVPRIGIINIKHELIALKNGQTYDTGEEVIDWVPPPPPPKDQYRGTQRSAIGGHFDTSFLHGRPITLSQGDVGVTIRKKETPLSCSINVDYQSKYPPLFEIKISEIKNLFAEKMPNNVKVAFKVEKGELWNGEEISGWRVFNTKEGEIETPILYEPPQCSESETDFLKIAGVCDFHYGPTSPVSIGKERFKKEIINPYCNDVTARITYTKNRTRDFNETKGQPGSYFSIEQRNRKENIRFEIFLTCEKEPRIEYEFDKKSLKMKIQRYHYQVNSARFQSATWEAQASNYIKNSDATGLRHEWNESYSASGMDFHLEPQSSRPSIEIRIDPSTGLVSRIHLPFYDITGTINTKSDISGVKRQKVGVEEELVPYNRNETLTKDLIINIQPTVDDRESCWKVSDDKNKKFFRGECSQIRKGTYLIEEETFKWEVIIRKNN